MADFINEIEKRRTFAIISHPDAGKTTLTEKLLLYGGAIRMAGSVKARKASKHAVSDWMEIEKQRGISVTSSVMQFNYEGYCINILDTPGHQDFSEDTYRTLMAADSAVMVVDAAKGIEAQTRKLFNVCSLRGIPIFTFINKMDRESKDPFELMQQLEDELGIKTYPVNWPIGSGKNFKGVYERDNKVIQVFDGGNHGQTEVETIEGNVDDSVFRDLLGDDLHDKLIEDIELLDIAGDEFDIEKLRKGELTPVFFGSALTNFGVKPFLESFLKLTPPPLARNSDQGEIDVFRKDFSAFIFKIQANMNKAHRDRIAFMRICSGEFKKGMEVFHVQKGNKVRLTQPQQFLAQDREIIDKAYAGDIIGVFDPGIFNIGDTLCESTDKFKFEGIPTFAPEHFARVRTVDTMKRKQFIKGITQISQEGAIQVFKEVNIGVEELIVGVVGVLQFEVLEYRLKNEYNVDIKMDRLGFKSIRWIENEDVDPKSLVITSDSKFVKDLNDRNLLLFQSEWSIGWVLEHNKGLVLSDISKS
ncbi:peptide chain release factor 3 [Clostridium pasteurianum DSM 525 = ATCC 6013]|uniref:Peptide chain release factor 3 n=1 Tax=Clostridium pasteurianum DSM 525 = ATCC 6013 TaxID=1262449 RepID=A0A0H3J8G3_CLOPA|nr:peptide chain release factor 3 [Clostridium pasteurianum]AJA47345.1 peptide chain release factor 3 [Clostridium pasteurianum DSM 525 = ATCC 6013]AJA51333.1 peptide chain release factor 3 [Clostridium pasteurianum DSM 525 = ATCC 6013]AOZ74680.1 peptide chain release factor 3 [Clostridium pasteurianum DSM 525 = ATCC 6013]AOZ78477.1 peptide chain release factor 3 [Clostridium pasteurianum]ELP58684.1 peptide chain release factor 3 [Clostridium pasteurianum DSM 525 = ATCC 6013]